MPKAEHFTCPLQRWLIGNITLTQPLKYKEQVQHWKPWGRNYIYSSSQLEHTVHSRGQSPAWHIWLAGQQIISLYFISWLCWVHQNPLLETEYTKNPRILLARFLSIIPRWKYIVTQALKPPFRSPSPYTQKLLCTSSPLAFTILTHLKPPYYACCWSCPFPFPTWLIPSSLFPFLCLFMASLTPHPRIPKSSTFNSVFLINLTGILLMNNLMMTSQYKK